MTLLELTKARLEIRNNIRDEFLTVLNEVAAKEITREGITLDISDMDDLDLVADYTAYLYRKRNSDDPAMPRSLRYRLNNRLFAENGAPDV